jgi:hypothetical protein
LDPSRKIIGVEAEDLTIDKTCPLRAMKAFQRFQKCQTIPIQHSRQTRKVRFCQLATIPGVKGERGIEVVEAVEGVEAKAEEGDRRRVKERALALRTQWNVTGSAIWAEANICMQSEKPLRCVTN